jgi:hypothetical protein
MYISKSEFVDFKAFEKFMETQEFELNWKREFGDNFGKFEPTFGLDRNGLPEYMVEALWLDNRVYIDQVHSEELEPFFEEVEDMEDFYLQEAFPEFFSKAA